MDEQQKEAFLRLAERALNAASVSKEKAEKAALAPLYDVPVQITAVLGRTTLPICDVLKMGVGSVVALDKPVGEDVDIYVNNRLIARGELVEKDGHFGVTLTEILKG